MALVLSAAFWLLLGNGSVMQGEVIILNITRSPKKSSYRRESLAPMWRGRLEEEEEEDVFPQ